MKLDLAGAASRQPAGSLNNLVSTEVYPIFYFYNF